ncbi:hypothetical protein S7711_03643 [Stachybotrys chartarum IBT 7711]|uniref:FAD linked oxidase N-terminal domain-containing protein n=1 Tax=Stachybotrys chartarum (strain CBS 109288 / IBT 7711) TaxID=1280523 RepID=A0A084AH02_STACB|nr:hypothetical protein S7711_03643 [Stachybotrys chartarum IBT 7711]
MKLSTATISSSFLFELVLSNRESKKPCKQLATRFPAQTLAQGTNDHNTQVTNGWSQSCTNRSYCVLVPESPLHVAGAIKILTATNIKFAVFGEGHMPMRGANTIPGGVLKLSSDKRVVNYGPSLRWGRVYEWMYAQGVFVNGGRFPEAGIGRILFDVGLNLWGSQYSWSLSHARNL